MPSRSDTSWRGPILVVVLASASLLALPAPTAAQLRPLDPMDWDVLDARSGDLHVALGLGMYSSQRASLAGTEGRLFELGAFRTTWSLGRVALELSGTAVRVFRDDTVFADPVAQARGTNGKSRVDAGDQRISTLVRLTDRRGPWDAALRFGVRLPTTDNRTGLERDQTDFFATLGGRYRTGALHLALEAGMGVLGTRSSNREQIDPLLYAFRATYDLGWVRPDLELVGQYDTRPTPNLRGNEDLTEVRLGVTRGRDRWIRLGLVRGLQEFSPALGVTLQVGAAY